MNQRTIVHVTSVNQANTHMTEKVSELRLFTDQKQLN